MRLLQLVIVALVLFGCDEGDRRKAAVAQEKAQKESQERAERYRAEREVEQKLMTDNPLPTLDERLNGWVSVKDGVVLFRGEWTIAGKPKSASSKADTWHAVPSSVPWLVRCDDLFGEGGHLQEFDESVFDKTIKGPPKSNN